MTAKPTPASKNLGRNAVVIGGSIAGLLTARVLSQYFDRVTVLERDPIHDEPEARKGEPQARHLHALLGQGLKIMSHYFPELPQALVEHGAVVDDMGRGARWYTFGGYRTETTTGIRAVTMSRPLLEWLVRRFTLAVPNITLRDQVDVEHPLFSDDGSTVTGLAAQQRGADAQRLQINADLVVDATGRGTATPKWLESAGYGKVPETAVKVNMGYATRVFKRKPGDLQGANLIIVSGQAPDKRSGLIFPVEGDRWIGMLAGMEGDYPPTDEQGYLEFARSLAVPDFYNLVAKLEPISDIMSHRLPSSLRRHYEKMQRIPEGYLVLGDAICSFNPVYGQGMTSASMQAEALDHLLASSATLKGIAPLYFKRVAKVVDIPWQIAVGEDFRYAETQGVKPPATDFINAYIARVHRATHSDPVVLGEFIKVMNLMQPPASLFKPSTVWRVLRARSKSPAPAPQLQGVGAD